MVAVLPLLLTVVALGVAAFLAAGPRALDGVVAGRFWPAITFGGLVKGELRVGRTGELKRRRLEII